MCHDSVMTVLADSHKDFFLKGLFINQLSANKTKMLPMFCPAWSSSGQHTTSLSTSSHPEEKDLTRVNLTEYE